MEGEIKTDWGMGKGRRFIQTRLEVIAGRAQTFTEALGCQLRFQALCMVIQSQVGELWASGFPGGPTCRFLNPMPALESHSGMKPKSLGLSTFSVPCPTTGGSEV